jgi:hypothetical protein
MAKPPLDRFLRFAEFTVVLNELAAAYPALLTLESIGHSHEGRDIWLCTVTNAATGPADEKPAMWIEANIHAVEVTAGVAAVHLLWSLCDRHGEDDRVTRALDTRAFYVVPRLNPDGVELTLSDHPRVIRSSTRPWPWAERHPQPGLRVEDVDGDGRVLTMRWPDPNGIWKAHPDDPRLLMPRRPDDGPDDGPYWRLCDEGTIIDFDGFTIPLPRPVEGLDMNRNYPAGWTTAQLGSGDFPGSEPEIQALLHAVVGRPNICIYNAFHTPGGMLLRPSSMRSDSDLPPDDVQVWKELSARGTELTGYPSYSVYEDYTWDRQNLMSGASDDWAYEHLGVFAWTTEFWDVAAAATGQRTHPIKWFLEHPVEDDLAMLRWNDERFGGRLYVDWKPFDHPQLGPVEIGGWNWLFSWVNPPPELLEAEVRPHADFAVFAALAAPCIEVLDTSVEPLGDSLWRVRVVVHNTGWLPTTVTDQGKRKSLVLAATVTLEPGDGVTVEGPARIELGQLAGKALARIEYGGRSDGTPDRAKAEWIVRGPEGAELVAVARHPRGGTKRVSITLFGQKPATTAGF